MQDTTYYVERKFFKLLGATIRTYDGTRNLLCRADLKAFKLRELITFYSDEAKSVPLFSAQARQIIDIAPTFDITDPSGTKLGALRRKGLSSTFVRDQWLILDANDGQIGEIVEDSTAMGLLRRFGGALVTIIAPQKFHISLGTQQVATIQSNRNPYTTKFTCTYHGDGNKQLGTLAFAIPSLLAIFDGEQG